MDFHLDRELRLHDDPERGWAINEIGSEGQKIGDDQMPWRWTLRFTATSCVLTDGIEIGSQFHPERRSKDETMTSPDPPEVGFLQPRAGGLLAEVEQHQIIRIELRPGHPREEGNFWRQTTFSMFGTDRAIKRFILEILPISDPIEHERCTAWGCPSYTTDIDFRNETEDDVIVFSLFVRQETFARYVAKVSRGLVDEIFLSVGAVEGFYSEWSPSISTRTVKVLTAHKEHKLTLPPDHQIEPPRLGRVGDAKLYIERRLEFGKPTPETEAVEEEEAPELRAVEQSATAQTVPQVPAAVDPRVLQTLRSLRRAAWFIVGLLALIFIATLSRH